MRSDLPMQVTCSRLCGLCGLCKCSSSASQSAGCLDVTAGAARPASSGSGSADCVRVYVAACSAFRAICARSLLPFSVGVLEYQARACLLYSSRPGLPGSAAACAASLVASIRLLPSARKRHMPHVFAQHWAHGMHPAAFFAMARSLAILTCCSYPLVDSLVDWSVSCVTRVRAVACAPPHQQRYSQDALNLAAPCSRALPQSGGLSTQPLGWYI